MAWGKKLKLKGFKVKEPPKRTREEIDREYADHAIQVGHKSRMLDQLQAEIDHHKNKLDQLSREPVAEPKPAPAAPAAEVAQTEGSAP